MDLNLVYKAQNLLDKNSFVESITRPLKADKPMEGNCAIIG